MDALAELWVLIGNKLSKNPQDFVNLVVEVCEVDPDDQSFGALLMFGVDIAGGSYDPDEVAAIFDSNLIDSTYEEMK